VFCGWSTEEMMLHYDNSTSKEAANELKKYWETQKNKTNRQLSNKNYAKYRQNTPMLHCDKKTSLAVILRMKQIITMVRVNKKRDGKVQ
jgi:hypothetical protein